MLSNKDIPFTDIRLSPVTTTHEVTFEEIAVMRVTLKNNLLVEMMLEIKKKNPRKLTNLTKYNCLKLIQTIWILQENL